MKTLLFCFVATLLLCNVSFAQDDAERKKHFKLVEKIMANPDKIADIIDSSEYYNSKVRANDVRDNYLTMIQSTIQKNFVINGQIRYSFLDDEDFKILSSDGDTWFHGIVYWHEVTVKNIKGNKFISFQFSRMAGIWYFSYIFTSSEYPRPRVPFCGSCDE